MCHPSALPSGAHLGHDFTRLFGHAEVTIEQSLGSIGNGVGVQSASPETVSFPHASSFGTPTRVLPPTTPDAPSLAESLSFSVHEDKAAEPRRFFWALPAGDWSCNVSLDVSFAFALRRQVGDS